MTHRTRGAGETFELVLLDPKLSIRQQEIAIPYQCMEAASTYFSTWFIRCTPQLKALASFLSMTLP